MSTAVMVVEAGRICLRITTSAVRHGVGSGRRRQCHGHINITRIATRAPTELAIRTICEIQIRRQSERRVVAQEGVVPQVVPRKLAKCGFDRPDDGRNPRNLSVVTQAMAAVRVLLPRHLIKTA